MKALLIIDVQNDFLPGGPLAVPHGEEIISVINEIQKAFLLIIATKDWHPKNHISFARRHGKQPGDTIILGEMKQVLWPEHCLQNTEGAEFPSALDRSKISKVIKKGVNSEIDSYSAFFDNSQGGDTGLASFLKEKKVEEVYIVGLATDFCVKSTVLDALKLGFKTCVIEKGCRAIGDAKRALKEMEDAGAIILPTLGLETFGKQR